MRRSFFVLATMLQASMAAADPCPPARFDRSPTYEQLFSKASTVLIARVYRVEAVKIERASDSSPPTTTVEGALRVSEVLKGTPPADNKVRAVVRLGCGMPLLAAADYLLFLDGRNVVEGDIPGSNTGARPLIKGPDGEVIYPKANQLKELRELAKEGRK